MKKNGWIFEQFFPKGLGNTEEIPKIYENVHPFYFKKHNMTVLSSDYTNLFSSTLVKLRLEKEMSQKWIFEIQNNVFNFNTYANIYLNHTSIITYCTYIKINYHITSKIMFYRNTLNTNCPKSRNNATLTTTITKQRKCKQSLHDRCITHLRY